ncbi:unnamed protein product, partial [Polarella glacialis]
VTFEFGHEKWFRRPFDHLPPAPKGMGKGMPMGMPPAGFGPPGMPPFGPPPPWPPRLGCGVTSGQVFIPPPDLGGPGLPPRPPSPPRIPRARPAADSEVVEVVDEAPTKQEPAASGRSRGQRSCSPLGVVEAEEPAAVEGLKAPAESSPGAAAKVTEAASLAQVPQMRKMQDYTDVDAISTFSGSDGEDVDIL